MILRAWLLALAFLIYLSGAETAASFQSTDGRPNTTSDPIHQEIICVEPIRQSFDNTPVSDKSADSDCAERLRKECRDNTITSGKTKDGHTHSEQVQLTIVEQSGKPGSPEATVSNPARLQLAAGSERSNLLAGGPAFTIARGPADGKAPQIVGGDTTINVMAPLLVGDPANPDGDASKKSWDEFDRQLTVCKELGVSGVSTDVWWGVVQGKGENQFDWKYYDKLSSHIANAGLKWVPILSFHECGGNVGDTVNVPLPKWLWDGLAEKVPSRNARSVQFVSEQGNPSTEYVSVWATDHALPYYSKFMSEFQTHYAKSASNISEINLSLGPSGEMRYPSYNSHDKGTGYPTRGALQCYSDLAKKSFQEFALKKYGDINGVSKAWNIEGLVENRILPPEDATGFFNRGDQQKLQYGKDLYDWYSDSLINHGRKMLSAGIATFGAKDAPFAGIDIGAKIPGIHWRFGQQDGKSIKPGDRLAELNAGLIRTSDSAAWYDPAKGTGYRPILSMFKEFQPLVQGRGTHVVPAMTCLELSDGQDGPSALSMPQTLARWVGQEARQQGMTIRGENALAGTLGDENAWKNIQSMVKTPKNETADYSGITLLRMGDVVNNPTARAKLSEIIHAIKSVKPVEKAPKNDKEPTRPAA